MKKLITLSAVLALSVATVVEAKSRGGFRSAAKPVATKPAATQPRTAANQQSDATFANTPNNMAAQQPARSGSPMAGAAMGAVAGYMLGDMMASNAHANQAVDGNAQQAVNSGQNIANAMPAIAEFRSIGGQIDPFLVEKTDGYRRYCIAGVQYLAASHNGQTAPTVMVNPNGSPLQCNLIP
ncbi:hypothetical protein PTQ27_09655 [Mannheimia sp. AT1]|uniref:Uncharacterized protein n=1 Tax=Mannheimia cairinae TaxID=3025936 RepID=A0ABT5MV16_9PAST|nr:hypothetical protein [Mannheimia cairinae]MDD0824723.1 hypothetical protein [Mannheimia cairinae]MDD0826348.1 hypothetical protein [Mannheimia cairinae]